MLHCTSIYITSWDQAGTVQYESVGGLNFGHWFCRPPLTCTAQPPLVVLLPSPHLYCAGPLSLMKCLVMASPVSTRGSP